MSDIGTDYNFFLLKVNYNIIHAENTMVSSETNTADISSLLPTPVWNKIIETDKPYSTACRNMKHIN